jgi:hypothetical protein
LLNQVADIERGQRIRGRREELHLTQPAVVDLMEEAAKALPDTHELHPSKLGRAPVGLRGYQTYEQGGGIVWEKAKLLAEVLHLDVQEMMEGPRETPDLLTPPPAPVDWYRRIEHRLDEHERILTGQSAALERIEAALGIVIETGAQNLAIAATAAGEALRSGTQGPTAAATTRSGKRSPRA